MSPHNPCVSIDCGALYTDADNSGYPAPAGGDKSDP